MTYTSRVLIVDDHPLVCRALRQIIEAESHLLVCGEASGATEALEVADKTQPDLAIVDLSLSEGNGLDLIAHFCRRFPRIRIVMLSVHDEAVYGENALRAGASGYVNKRASVDVIIAAIRKVQDGAIYASPSTLDQMLQATCGGTPLNIRPLERLSSRELQVFELLGQGLSVAQSAKQLFLSPKTVGTYCEGIKSKLHLEAISDLRYHAIQWHLRQARPSEMPNSPEDRTTSPPAG